jgi:rare lipoprotein A
MTTTTTCNTRSRNRCFTAAALALVVTVAGVTANSAESSHSNGDVHPVKTRKWTQVGKASWYGRRFQGKRTASGEAFDLNLLTCAHRTLPIGTLLRVTNLMNRKSIMVRVNDRGPVPEGLIVDLSFGAAKSLGFNHAGRAKVRLDRVDGAEAAQLNWPNLGRPEYPVGTR